jgi:uncharacterized protein YecE (DUF72 family)
VIRIGTAGWSIPQSQRATFPGEGTHLSRYARMLPCVEINSSFYRPHRPEVYRKWATQTPRTFRFSVKLPRQITHDARLRGIRSALVEFLSQACGLGRRLGPLLVQLPPSLEYESRIANRFFALMRERHAGEIVCEPRHPSWFTDAAESLLVRFRVARVAADPALLAAAARPAGHAAVAYFRLHGSPRMYWSNYEPERLAAWTRMLRQCEVRSDVWCIFDNTAGNSALNNALAVNAAVAARRLRGPASTYP